MPLFLLMGGEFVFAFMGARIAWWIWRSRGQLQGLLGGGPGPGSGLPAAAPGTTRPRLRVLASPAPPAPRRTSRRRPLRRAA